LNPSGLRCQMATSLLALRTPLSIRRREGQAGALWVRFYTDQVNSQVSLS
jgi:hypothetical protein